MSQVSRSHDFLRIDALEIRDWKVRPFVDNVVKELTEELRTPEGAMELWTVQAVALFEIAVYGGAFLPVGVGGGKALISLLAPVVLGAERPLLLVPAKLRDQTLSNVIPKMREHWKLPESLKVESYSMISLEKKADFLEEYAPDLIVMDEVHHLSRTGSARTRRVNRYFNQHPETKCVAMSGTISKRSIKDWAHIARWALKHRAPVPEKWNELQDWSDAIDGGTDTDPGLLWSWCLPGENVRQGYQRRLVLTPGVIASRENEVDCSLQIFGKKDVGFSDSLKKEIQKMRKLWETPDGEIIIRAVDLWRHMRELALGFFYRWKEQPPREWLEARTNWKRFVRETIKHNRRGLDTELQVANECDRNGIAENHPLSIWRAVKDCFDGETVAEWIDETALKACKQWLAENEGIVWVEHIAFGQELFKYSGKSYFGAGDNEILTTPKPSIIASIAAHSEGKNLQRFSKNLVVAPMTSGRAWEQLLGRTHRPGQEEDEVTVEVFQHVQELRDSFEQARMDARYLEETYGNRQKLNYADIVV